MLLYTFLCYKACLVKKLKKNNNKKYFNKSTTQIYHTKIKKIYFKTFLKSNILRSSSSLFYVKL